MSELQSDPLQIAAFYDVAAKAYEEIHGNISQHIEDFVALLPSGGRILEIGFGPGEDSNYFKQHGFDVTAIDISPEMVRLARRKFPHVNFELGDMRNLHLTVAPESLDGLFVEFALIHIPKIEVSQVFQGFHHVLKPGGILRLGLQEGESQEVNQPAPFYSGMTIFLNIMSQQESQSLLGQHGFAIIQQFQRPPRTGQHPFIKRVIHARKIPQQRAG